MVALGAGLHGVQTHRRHAEHALIDKIARFSKTRGHSVNITVIRARFGADGALEYSFARPCRHCAARLRSFGKKRGVCVSIAYSVGRGDAVTRTIPLRKVPKPTFTLSSGARARFKR